jgi:small multidrug resistance pump
MIRAFALLLLAIVAEVIGTTALKMSYGMTKLGPGAVVVVGYAMAFWLLSLTLKTMPVGFVYAVWSALGIAGIRAIGVVLFKETFDLFAIVGTILVIAGVLTLTLSWRGGH